MRYAVGMTGAIQVACVLFALFALATPRSAVASTARAEAERTLWIIGDSTVRNGNGDGVGWGEVLAEHFDTDRIAIANRAIGGRSSRTYRLEGRWQAVLDEAKPGDFVLIQFGHNDGANPQDPEKPRGSLRGIGEETVNWTHPHLNEPETIHTYGWYMRQYVAEAKGAGLTPIVVSYVPRAPRRGEEMRVELDELYGTWSKQVAEQADAAFINLYGRVAEKYRAMEQEQPHSVKERLFVGGDRDYTHTVLAGAELNAVTLLEGIRDLDGDAGELATFLKENVEHPATRAAAPQGERPWFQEARPAMDPNLPTLWIIGDSTVRNGRDNGWNGQWGWGHPIRHYFDESRLNVQNRAVGGMSSRTFYRDMWPWILPEIKAGDFVLMQFGHNDKSAINDDSRARGTFRDNSERAELIDNMLTGESEWVHSYGWYLRQYAIDAESRGAAQVVILSPIPRNRWNEAGDDIAADDFAAVSKEAADQVGVEYVDLNARTIGAFQRIGRDRMTGEFFPESGDTVHPAWPGAILIAEQVIEGLREINSPLVEFLQTDPPADLQPPEGKVR